MTKGEGRGLLVLTVVAVAGLVLASCVMALAGLPPASSDRCVPINAHEIGAAKVQPLHVVTVSHAPQVPERPCRTFRISSFPEILPVACGPEKGCSWRAPPTLI